ncbi:hypothetical protein [Blastococcus xanthinilyticus]|uniref:Uncharacterized protein n=1 Tax=Blastococcus xanthinilyticus TaxID=1564164 RepID=A0A5S5CRT7_9ACTN|nr:hypothetical protein [Blastococcus xanthinilyticus]TYP82920.1 hypothetical protein BD833_11752 [Blastococcus xanthinilyticus]
MDRSARGNAVTEAIDGATGDWSLSGDAMRWSPDLLGRAPGEVGPPAAGPDLPGVRRLVTGALSSLGAVATDVVGELRQLTRGSAHETPAERTRDG